MRKVLTLCIIEKDECVLLGMKKRGVLEFVFEGRDIHEVHIYYSREFLGNPSESEEMAPQWFARADIPFSDMWVDTSTGFLWYLKANALRAGFYSKVMKRS